MKLARSISIPLLLLLASTSCDDSAPSNGQPDTEIGDDSDVDASDFEDVEPDAENPNILDAWPDSPADAVDAADAQQWPPSLMSVDDALAAVDRFIGTGGIGYGVGALNPAVQAPFGMVRLGPDTTNFGNHPDMNHFGGYYFNDPHVRGFSHTHFVGTGVADYGNLRVLPVTVLPDDPTDVWEPFSKTDESATPERYDVSLQNGVSVALTSSLRCGVHRYEFPADGGFVLFDTASSVRDQGVLASETRVSASAVSGWVEYDGNYVGRTLPFTLYFDATLDSPAADTYVWNDDGYQSEVDEATGVMTGAVLHFDSADTVVLRVGLSFVDAEQALANRVDEVDGQSFDEVVEANRAMWANKLGRVRIGGVTDDIATIFYTALYNVYRMPTRLDGVDGRYRGLDDEIHEGTGFAYHSDLSLWDTFRTLHPWLVLTDVNAQRDMLLSLMAMRDQGGYFPRWPAALSYTGGMIGTSADLVFAGSALKGVDGVDYEAAFDGLLETASGPTEAGHAFSGRNEIDEYLTYGYVTGSHRMAVSKTLEYAYADWALANLAEHLERDEAAALRVRGRNYRLLFEPESQFMLPRDADGNFDTTVNVTTVFMNDGAYTEGTPWHWRFYALQDPDDFRDLFGGAEQLGEALEKFFSYSQLGLDGPVQTFVPDRYYWHGNEPTIHSAYLFHAADRYDRLAHWVREIQTRLYTTEPDGIPGNDDGGTLSSWYLFNAIGLYPIAGGDQYALSTPLVPYAEIDLDGGAMLTVIAEGASLERRYVESVTLNGVEIEGGYVSHADLFDATLLFEMSE